MSYDHFKWSSIKSWIFGRSRVSIFKKEADLNANFTQNMGIETSKFSTKQQILIFGKGTLFLVKKPRHHQYRASSHRRKLKHEKIKLFWCVLTLGGKVVRSTKLSIHNASCLFWLMTRSTAIIVMIFSEFYPHNRATHTISKCCFYWFVSWFHWSDFVLFFFYRFAGFIVVW